MIPAIQMRKQAMIESHPDKWHEVMDLIAQLIPGGWQTIGWCALLGAGFIITFIFKERVRVFGETGLQILKTLTKKGK